MNMKRYLMVGLGSFLVVIIVGVVILWSNNNAPTTKTQPTSTSVLTQPTVTAPPVLNLVEGVTMTGDTFVPGDRIEATFTIQNDGQDVWRPQKLGVGVKGPFYLDFGWQKVTLAPGESFVFAGAIPNAPGILGDYKASATWQDDGGEWHDIGDLIPFTVVSPGPPNTG